MPDKILSKDQLSQLDGNIRKMVSNGLGREDIDAYARDFKERFGKSDGASVAPAAPVAPVVQAAAPVPKYQKAINDDRSRVGKLAATIYNGLVGSFESLAGFGAEALGSLGAAIPTPQYNVSGGYMPQTKKPVGIAELAPAQQVEAKKSLKKSVKQGFDVLRSDYVSREEEKQLQGKFDVTNGIGLDDIEGLVAMSGRMAGDIGLGAVSGGSTYFMQAYSDAVDDYDESVAKLGIKENPNARALYGVAGGTINGLLEKFAIDKIVGDGPIFKDIQKKVLANVLKNTANMSGKAAIDAIEAAAKQEIKALTSGIKQKGLKAAYRSLVEAGTEGLQAGLEDGAKFATNWAQGVDVFNEKEIKDQFFKNMLNSAAAGGVFGPVIGFGMDKTFGQNVNTQVLKDIAEANTPEQLAAINDELAATFDENNFTQEERDAVMANANRYAQIKQTLPAGTNAIAQTIAIPLIENRIKLDNEIQTRRNSIETIDEAFRADEESAIALLEDKRAQINDDIREVVNNEKFDYYEENGKFYKKLGDNAPEEISKNRFDLQQLKTEGYATTTGQGPVQEGGTAGDIGQRQGTQEGGTQETPPQTDTSYRYIVSEEGSEFPVRALVNKKVRKDGRPAILYQEGQRIVARILGTNRIEDVGNVVEMMDALPQDFGIEVDETVVTETPTGYRVEGEDMVNDSENPLDAISTDQNGNVMNVVLKTPAGKRRKFRGQAAKDLAYQITLKETLKNEDEFELFLEQEHQAELDAAEAKAAAEAATNAANEPVPPVEGTTTGPTTGPTDTTELPYGVGVSISEDNRIDEINKRVKLGDPNSNARKYSAISTAQSLIKLLKSKFPNLDIVIHETEGSYNKAMEEVGGVSGSEGSFSYSRDGQGSGLVGRIDINLSIANQRTVRHEVAHALMLHAFGDNPKLFKKFREKMSSIIDESSNQTLSDFASQYDEDASHEEYLVELAAILSGQGSGIETTTLQKIANAINEIISSITNGRFKPFQDIKDTTEVIEFFNGMAESLRNGTEFIPTEVQMAYRETDTNSLGLSGEIDATGVTSKSSINSGDIKRFPVNPNTTVQEDVPLSTLNGKRVNLMESDRMTGGYIANSEGNPLYKFYGGVFYPIITGKWWASRNVTKAKGLAKNANKNRDKDGYVYSAPMIGSANQHMSNNDMLATTIELMKYDLKDKRSKVKKEDVIAYINKAFSRKKLEAKMPVLSSFLSKTTTINDIFNNLEFYMFQEGKDILNRDGQKVLDNEGNPISNFTFEQRKMIVESILGDPKVKETRFPSAGSISDAAKRFEEPITSKATRLGDMVTVMRTKGTLKWKKSDPSDPFYHKSYPVEIYAVDESGNPAEIEVMVLDGAYSMRDVLPKLDKSSGKSFTWEGYLKKHKKVSEVMAESQYNRTAKLSYAAGNIVTKARKAPTKAITKEKFGGVKKTFKEQVRYGLLGKESVRLKEKMSGELSAELATAETRVQEAMKTIKKYGGAVTEKDISDFMEGKTSANQLPLDLATQLTEMRAQIDGLTERLIQLGVIDSQESIDYYRENKGKYLLRSYEAINFKENPLMSNFQGKGLNIDNVAKKLKNVDQTVVNTALQYLSDRAKAANPALTDAEAMKIARADANEILSDSEDYVMNKGMTGSTNVKSLRQRKDISPEIRALMGEYTDPLYNYYATIFKISSLTSSRQYLNSLKEFGMGNFFFTEKTEDATVKFAGDESDALAPLNGIWTFPEIKESLKVAEKETTTLVSQMAGRVRMLKTVYNPATHVKNIIGNMGFAVSNGHWQNIPESYKYIRAAITGKTDQDIMNMMDTLNRYGVLNNVIGVGELKAYFDKNESVDDFLKTIYNNANSSTTASKLGKAKANLSKIPKAIEKAYAIEDDVFKILAFVNESNRYSKALFDKNYNKLSDDQKREIDNIASEIVKDTYPTFSRVPKGVRTLSKFAFLGNFLAFPVESVRTQYNSLNLAVKEMRSGNEKLKSVGRLRLSGAIIYNSLFASLSMYAYNLAGAGITGAIGMLFGDDEEKNETSNAIKKNLAPWNKNSDVYVSKFKDGMLEYYDIGSLDSYGYQRRVWNAFWSTKNKGEFDQMMASGIGEALDPWMTKDFVIDNYMKLSSNDNGRGGTIYNPEGKPMDKFKDMSLYVGKQFGPGAVGSAIKVAEAYQKGEYEKVMDELGAQVFARRYSVDLNKQFQNYIYTEGTDPKKEVGFKYRLENAEKIYRDAKRQKLSPAKLSEKYGEALEAYKEVLLTANEYYKAAALGGTNPKLLIESLKKSRIGRAEAIAIITGSFGKYDQAYIRK